MYHRYSWLCLLFKIKFCFLPRMHGTINYFPFAFRHPCRLQPYFVVNKPVKKKNSFSSSPAFELISVKGWVASNWTFWCQTFLVRTRTFCSMVYSWQHEESTAEDQGFKLNLKTTITRAQPLFMNVNLFLLWGLELWPALEPELEYSCANITIVQTVTSCKSIRLNEMRLNPSQSLQC